MNNFKRAEITDGIVYACIEIPKLEEESQKTHEDNGCKFTLENVNRRISTVNKE